MLKLKDISKAQVKTFGRSQKELEAIHNFFWRDGVKKNLSQANHRSIYIKHLGTITVSRYKLRVFISEEIEKIRNIKKNTRFSEARKAAILADRLANLKQLCMRRDEIARDILANRPNKVRLRPLTIHDYRKLHE